MSTSGFMALGRPSILGLAARSAYLNPEMPVPLLTLLPTLSPRLRRDPSRPGGLVSRCKACSSCKQDNCTTKARPTVTEPTVTERACSSCKQIKPASEVRPLQLKN